MSLRDWNQALVDELGLDLDVDIKQVLNVARSAAHSAERAAAPLTAFLVGYAAGRRGGSRDDITACADIATALAARWAVDHPPQDPR